jgi:putative selenium metabolism protein SsnA
LTAEAEPEVPSIALTGGTVVVALDPPEVLEGVDVVIAGDRVAEVGSAPTGIPRRDCSGTLVIPGNVCAHHHLYSALARGMPYNLAPPRDFVEILQRVWWRLDRALDESSVRASALRGGLDALLAGTTSIVDHHASPIAIDGSLDVIAESLARLGVRSVLCYEVTDRDGEQRARAGIAENARFASRAATQSPLARAMIGAHASFTLSPETLAATVDAAGAAGVGMHVHIAEDVADEVDARARFGASVIERFESAGALDERSLLAHCVHVGEAELGIVERTASTVVCNPRSNMNNGVGHSPFNHRGGKVALGTDGIDGDMFAEAKAGFFRAKEADLAVPFSWPLERLGESARVVARAFGEPLLGTLLAGAPADIVVLDAPAPTPLDRDNLAGHLIFGLASNRVRDVFVAGELVVEDHRSTRLDERELADESRREALRLWRRMDETPAHDYAPKEVAE